MDELGAEKKDSKFSWSICTRQDLKPSDAPRFAKAHPLSHVRFIVTIVAINRNQVRRVSCPKPDMNCLLYFAGSNPRNMLRTLSTANTSELSTHPSIGKEVRDECDE